MVELDQKAGIPAGHSRYSLVVLAAKRAKQLKEGAPPLIEPTSANMLTVALAEIAAGRISGIEMPEPEDEETRRPTHTAYRALAIPLAPSPLAEAEEMFSLDLTGNDAEIEASAETIELSEGSEPLADFSEE